MNYGEKEEIYRLKRENRRLKAELSRLRSYQIAERQESTAEERIFIEVCRSASLSAKGNYFEYLKDRLLTAPLYSTWQRVLSYFRRARLISTVIKVTAAALTVVGTGAFFLFLSGTLLVFIPLVLIFLVFFYLSGLVSRRRRFEELSERLSSKNIYLLFPPRGRPFRDGSCFAHTLRIISDDTENSNFIIIVSPYVLSPKGFGDRLGERYYHILRYDSHNVCIIRRNAYFALRKRVLSRFLQNLIIVH